MKITEEDLKQSKKSVGTLIGRLWKRRKYDNLGDEERPPMGSSIEVGDGHTGLNLTEQTLEDGRHTRVHYESEDEESVTGEQTQPRDNKVINTKHVAFHFDDGHDKRVSMSHPYSTLGISADNHDNNAKHKKKKKKKKLRKKVKKGTWKAMKKSWKYFKAGMIQFSQHSFNAFSFTSVVTTNVHAYAQRART